jgi:hypothetical protein
LSSNYFRLAHDIFPIRDHKEVYATDINEPERGIAANFNHFVVLCGAKMHGKLKMWRLGALGPPRKKV